MSVGQLLNPLTVSPPADPAWFDFPSSTRRAVSSVPTLGFRKLGDVSKLQLGDTINVTFSRALLLRADKSSPPGIRERIDKGFTTGQALGSPLSMHRV